MLKYYLIEEYRRHIYVAKKYSLFLFPAYIVFFTVLGAFSVQDVFQIYPYKPLIRLIMMSMFLYGFGVGSYELLGRSREHYNLINTSTILPVDSRTSYLMLFLRDAIYYTILFMVPTYVGFLISVPFTTLELYQVSFFSLTLTLSMLFGYAVAYATFPFAHIYKKIYNAILLAIFIYLPLQYFNILPFPPAELQIQKTPFWFVLSTVPILLFSAFGYLCTPREFRDVSRKYRNRLKMYHSRFKDILLAKEMEDIIRGGIIIKALLTYFFPVVIIFVFLNMINTAMRSDVYNALSHAIMLSIFSTVIYSWLTIMDPVEYLAILPLTSGDLIKTHIKAYFILVILIAIPILVILDFNAALLLVPATGMFCLNTLYLLSMTANLAGHRMNSMLFNPGIIMKFVIYSIVPGIILVIASFELNFVTIGVMLATAIFMVIITAYNLKKIKTKWIYF